MTSQKTFIQSERKTPGWDVGLWFSWQKQAISRGTCWVIPSYCSCSTTGLQSKCLQQKLSFSKLFERCFDGQDGEVKLVDWIMLIWEIQNVSIYNAAFFLFCYTLYFNQPQMYVMRNMDWAFYWRKWTIWYDMIWYEKLKVLHQTSFGGLRQIHFQPSPALNCFQLVIATQSPAWFIFIFHPMCLCDSTVDTTSEWSAQTLQGQLLLILSDKDKILTTATPESRHTV